MLLNPVATVERNGRLGTLYENAKGEKYFFPEDDLVLANDYGKLTAFVVISRNGAQIQRRTVPNSLIKG